MNSRNVSRSIFYSALLVVFCLMCLGGGQVAHAQSSSSARVFECPTEIRTLEPMEGAADLTTGEYVISSGVLESDNLPRNFGLPLPNRIEWVMKATMGVQPFRGTCEVRAEVVDQIKNLSLTCACVDDWLNVEFITRRAIVARRCRVAQGLSFVCE